MSQNEPKSESTPIDEKKDAHRGPKSAFSWLEATYMAWVESGSPYRENFIKPVVE